MRSIILSVIITLLVTITVSGQQNSGVIKGRIYNSKTNEGIPFATVQIW